MLHSLISESKSRCLTLDRRNTNIYTVINTFSNRYDPDKHSTSSFQHWIITHIWGRFFLFLFFSPHFVCAFLLSPTGILNIFHLRYFPDKYFRKFYLLTILNMFSLFFIFFDNICHIYRVVSECIFSWDRSYTITILNNMICQNVLRNKKNMFLNSTHPGNSPHCIPRWDVIKIDNYVFLRTIPLRR